jgi:hypothetical protein
MARCVSGRCSALDQLQRLEEVVADRGTPVVHYILVHNRQLCLTIWRNVQRVGQGEWFTTWTPVHSGTKRGEWW